MMKDEVRLLCPNTWEAGAGLSAGESGEKEGRLPGPLRPARSALVSSPLCFSGEDKGFLGCDTELNVYH